MYNVLSVNKSGMKANQRKMDGVAHDLANVNTHGYKRKEINFEELRFRELEGDVLKSRRAEDLGLNMGTKSGLTKTTFNQGSLTPASGKFNMAITGEGFFGVRDENGNLMLTRNGNFHQDNDGRVSDEFGYPLEMETYLPFGDWTGEISISKTGEIASVGEGQPRILGRVILYKVDNPHELISLGEGHYVGYDNARLRNSIDDEGFGDINQFFLEESNVEMTKSMVDMITTQRAYSMNAKALQTTDEIMTLINNIKR